MFSICDGSAEGAGILGLHLEGPFISLEKRGAHPPQCILPIKEGFKDLCEVYGDLEKVCLVTVAPELDNALSVIQELKKRNITVSIGSFTCYLLTYSHTIYVVCSNILMNFSRCLFEVCKWL